MVQIPGKHYFGLASDEWEPAGLRQSTEMCRSLSDCSYLKSTSLPDELTNFGIGLNEEGFQKRWKC